jgi:ubiquinone/menaquinone biosynthesis C-methylase UbiE
VAINHLKRKIKNVDARVGTAEDLPWPDNTFDYISCIGVFERVLNQTKVIYKHSRLAYKSTRLPKSPSVIFCV